MAVDRLSSTSALIASLRSELARRPSRTGSADESTTPLVTGSRRRDVEQLRRQLVDLVKDLPDADQPAIDALRPRFVRAILLWEYGPALREHPDWQVILDNIVQAIGADPTQQRAFKALLEELRQSSADQG